MNTMDAVFDYAGSMQRMGDDEQLFRTMVAFLHNDGERRLAELRERLEEGDLAEVERLVHVLKGQISNFGAPRAWNAAARIEAAGQRRDLRNMPADVDELSQALAELLTALGLGHPRRQFLRERGFGFSSCSAPAARQRNWGC